MDNFVQSIINPVAKQAKTYVSDFANSAIGQGLQGKFQNVIPAIGNELSGIQSGKVPISFGGEMETLPMTTAAFEGIQMPQYGMPRADVSDLEGAMDTIQNAPRSSQAKDSFNTLQDIVERYAPKHVNDTNDQLLGTASRILDAHYGNGASTIIEPLNHNH